MDNGDVELVYVKKNIPASDVLVSNKSLTKYKIGVKIQGSIDMSNFKDKTDDQSDSKREYFNNTRTETEDQLNSKR